MITIVKSDNDFKDSNKQKVFEENKNSASIQINMIDASFLKGQKTSIDFLSAGVIDGN